MNQPPLNPDAISGSPELFEVASAHHFHGNECLCGFVSPVSRQRTEHIMYETLAAALPEVTSVEEADNLPIGSVIILSNGTARLRTDWSSGWASAKAGDDYPTDDKGCFPARVLYRPEVNDA